MQHFKSVNRQNDKETFGVATRHRFLFFPQKKKQHKHFNTFQRKKMLAMKKWKAREGVRRREKLMRKTKRIEPEGVESVMRGRRRWWNKRRRGKERRWVCSEESLIEKLFGGQSDVREFGWGISLLVHLSVKPPPNISWTLNKAQQANEASSRQI